MPQIPQYGGPQVQQEALRPVYQNTPDVSSGAQAVARGIGQVAQVLDAKADREFDMEAFGAQERILKAQNDWEFEARRDAQGDKAVGFADRATAEWERIRQSEFSKLSPEAQRRAGRALSASYRASVEAARSYERQQVEIGARAKLDGSLQQLQAQAIKAGPDGAAGVIDAGVQTIRDFGQKRGVDVTPQITRFTSGVHLNVLDSLMQRDAEKASEYYKTHRDQLDPATWDRVEKAIKGEGDNQFATQFAAQNAALPLAEQIAKAGEIKDPERREKTLLQIKNQHGMVKAAQQEAQQAAADEAWTQYVDKRRRVPERLRAAMGESNLRQLIAFEQARADHAASKGNAPVKTDPVAHAALWEMATRDPEAFKKERLPAYAMKLAQGDLEQLYRMQQGLLNPKGEGDIVKWNNKVTARLELLGASTGKSTEVKRGQFRTAAQKEFEAYQRANGRAPSPEDEDKILDRLSLPGKSGWFSDGEADTYAESVATGKKFVPKISSEERAAIRKTFKSRGVENPTDEQIAEVFKRMKGL